MYIFNSACIINVWGYTEIFPKRNEMYFNEIYIQSIWSKISFLAPFSFRAIDMFLWKAVKVQISHALQSLPLPTPIYANILFNWPRKFSGETCFQKKSLNVIVSFYTDTLFTQEIVPSLYRARAVFLRRRGKLDTYSGNLERGKSCMRENTNT